MGSSYAEIKTLAGALYGSWVGQNALVESEAGSPSTLAAFIDFVHGLIMSDSNEWEFAKEIGTITLDGSTEYDLSVLFPGLITVYQLFNIDDNQEHLFLNNALANISPIRGWTLRGKTLVFSGDAPTSGTAKIQFKTQYLVEDSLGVRKRFFEDDSDVSVLDIADTNVLIFGLGRYVNWKADEKNRAMREDVKEWYATAFESMILRPVNTRQVTSML